MVWARDSDTSVGKGPTTDDPETMAVIERFRESAKRAEPEPVDGEAFAEFLAGLYGSARMICDVSSFYEWVYEREEVNKFNALKTVLDREDFHVRGDRTGHYAVYIYYIFDRPAYIEIEWVPAAGYCYEEVKVFKVGERSQGIPLGSVVSVLQAMGR